MSSIGKSIFPTCYAKQWWWVLVRPALGGALREAAHTQFVNQTFPITLCHATPLIFVWVFFAPLPPFLHILSSFNWLRNWLAYCNEIPLSIFYASQEFKLTGRLRRCYLSNVASTKKVKNCLDFNMVPETV